MKVAAIMTAPRYEHVATRSRIERSLALAGVPLTISQGVFYGQCMQRMMESFHDKVDFLVVVDFDSYFTPDQVRRLLAIIDQRAEIDALAALEPQRSSGLAIGSGETTATDGILKVDTAHFGLTAIDTCKLAHVEKPWFFAQPDEVGGWGDNRIDPDVWFWRQWTKAGNSVCIDTGCRIGHMEERVSYFDSEGHLQSNDPMEWK